ncbi:MAG: EcsC family protein [Mycobacterium sp.]
MSLNRDVQGGCPGRSRPSRQRVTKRKLGQFVPVAGIGNGAALNFKMVDAVADAAYWAYRERFRYEKTGRTAPIIIEAERAPDDLAELPTALL